MTQLTRQQVTSGQAAAIESYHGAERAVAYNLALMMLERHGLTESQATQAIAMGYTIIDEKGTII